MLEPSGKSRRIRVIAASFGASALIVQTEFLRTVLDVTSGGTIVVGAVLSAWLLAIALGALAGTILAARSRQLKGYTLAACFLALPAGLFLLFCLASIRSLSHVPTGVIVPLGTTLGWSFLAAAPYALLVGITFPLLAALADSDSLSGSAPVVGGLWAAEAAGAFVSGVVFTFLLAGRSAPVTNVAIFGVLPALAATAAFLRGRRSVVTVLAAAVVVASTCAALYLGPAFTALEWRGLGAPGVLLESTWTRYRALKLSESEGQFTLFDNSEPVLNFPDPYGDLNLAALLLSQNPKAENALCVGPASAGLAQSLLAAIPGRLTAVHPDERLEWLIRTHLPESLRTPLDEVRYEYCQADARAWLGSPETGTPARLRATRPAGWGLLYLDLPGPTEMNSSRYYTPEFFRRAARAVGPAGGLLALRLPYGAAFALPAQEDQAASIWAALKASFSHLALAAGPAELYFFASDSAGLLSRDLTVLQGRLESLETKVPGLSRYLLDPYYESDRVEGILKTLDSRSSGMAAHTDLSPVAWFSCLRLRLRMAAGQQPGLLEPLLDKLVSISPYRLIAWPAAVVGLLLFMGWELAGGERGREMRFFSVLGMTVIGFAGMGVTVILVYVCQLVFGALFQQVALITAAFMLALALGAGFSARQSLHGARIAGKVPWWSLLLGLAILASAGMPFILEPVYANGAWGELLAGALFYLEVAAVGFLAGALFPRAAEAHALGGAVPRHGFTAGALDFADHLGAACGAALVGVLLIPAWGLVPTVISIALTLFCLGLFWFLLARVPGESD